DVRQFPARLANLDGTRIARGNDFDDAGKLTSGVFALTEKDATGIAEALKKADISVADIENKPYRRRPAAPFRTTTLQQEAGRKLGFSTDRT
ncbi:DNA topoisomerase, partial [Propionimicrobium lymphophilum]